MELYKAIQERRSIRKYKAQMVSQEVIARIVEAGLWAASGHGQQSTVVIAVTDKKMRDRLMKVNREIGGWEEGFDPFYGAPVVLVVLANKECPTYVYDGALTMGNLLLAAHEEGLGSCWIHRAKETFEKEEWKEWLKTLGLDGEYEGIGHCILGYADGPEPRPSLRKEGRFITVASV